MTQLFVLYRNISFIQQIEWTLTRYSGRQIDRSRQRAADNQPQPHKIQDPIVRFVQFLSIDLSRTEDPTIEQLRSQPNYSFLPNEEDSERTIRIQKMEINDKNGATE